MKSVLGQSAHAWMPATGEAVEANLPPLRPKATPPTSTPTMCWATVWCFAQVHTIRLVSVGTVVASGIPKVPPPLCPLQTHHQVWQFLTEAPCAEMSSACPRAMEDVLGMSQSNGRCPRHAYAYTRTCTRACMLTPDARKHAHGCTHTSTRVHGCTHARTRMHVRHACPVPHHATPQLRHAICHAAHARMCTAGLECWAATRVAARFEGAIWAMTI